MLSYTGKSLGRRKQRSEVRGRLRRPDGTYKVCRSLDKGEKYGKKEM